MSNGPSRKELRRQAALREMERRSQEAEDEARQAATDVNWSTATILSAELRDQILRLGGLPQAPTSPNAIDILTRQIKWPERPFRSSERRFRELNAGSVYESMSSIEMQDYVPNWCHAFVFSRDASFYPDWESDFTAVDAEAMSPFGADGHYFFLLGPNINAPTDPLVYTVDHETVNETPYNREGLTVTQFLSLLATA